MELRGAAIAISLGCIGLSLSFLIRAPETTEINFGALYPFIKGSAFLLIFVGCLVIPICATRFRRIAVIGIVIILGTITVSFLLEKYTGGSIGTPGWVSAFVGIIVFIPAGILLCVISSMASLVAILERDAAARKPIMISFGIIALLFVAFYIMASRTPKIMPLLEILQAPDRQHDHFSAASDLSQIDNPHMIEPLIALLKDTNPQTRAAAALALGGKSRTVKAITPLRQALSQETDIDAGEWMIRTLGTIAALAHEPQRSRVLTSLINRLSHEDERIKNAAAQGLGFIGDERAIPALIDSLHDEDVNFSAHNALLQITGQHFESNPDEWSTWWQETSTSNESSTKKTP